MFNGKTILNLKKTYFFDKDSFKICIENYIPLVFTFEENAYLFFRQFPGGLVLQSIILSLMLKEGQRNRNREHVYMKRRFSSWL